MNLRLTVPCPAKVNLFLSVGPPDGAGYHPLRTLFQAVGLFDDLMIVDGVETTSIESDWPELPRENTLAKTLRLAAELADIPPIRIRLTKRIPPQSGLGGGSSDAAGLLRALGILTRGTLKPKDQMEIARAVGADVPFFLVGGRARGEGYGERLTTLEDPPESWFLIARPEVGCVTQEAYRRLDKLPRELREFPIEDKVFNDFENVAPPESRELLSELRSLSKNDAGLTGSGSAVFARFPNQMEAERVGLKLESNLAAQKWVVKALSRKESVSHRVDQE